MYLILELVTLVGVLVFLAAGLFAATTLAVLTIASAQAVYAKSSRFLSRLSTAAAELRGARSLLPSRRPESSNF